MTSSVVLLVSLLGDFGRLSRFDRILFVLRLSVIAVTLFFLGCSTMIKFVP